jgi:hypothetical protein
MTFRNFSSYRFLVALLFISSASRNKLTSITILRNFARPVFDPPPPPFPPFPLQHSLLNLDDLAGNLTREQKLSTHQKKTVQAVKKEGAAALKSIIAGEGPQANGEATYFDSQLAGRIARIQISFRKTLIVLKPCANSSHGDQSPSLARCI